jgi:3'(2'), 5'-bisphosphate nucleotidase
MELHRSLENETDSALAATLARDAGEFLREFRANSSLQTRALGDAADHAANELLLTALRQDRPNDAILSEESTDNLARLDSPRVWIIDPLDGTREYREGRDDWAVHVALVEAGQVTAAAVSIPARGEVFFTAVPRTERFDFANQIVISRSRPPAIADQIASALNAQLVQVGSAGAKAMMVVRGDAIAYVHEGGMNEWDAAAPVGVALAHGLHVSTLKGEPVRFNQRDVVLRDGLIICAKNVASTIFAAL